MDVVGGTIGAVGGALIGFKNKMNFLQDVIEGAVSGAILSHKITRLTFDQFLQCDHVDEHDYFLHLVTKSCIYISNFNIFIYSFCGHFA